MGEKGVVLSYKLVKNGRKAKAKRMRMRINKRVPRGFFRQFFDSNHWENRLKSIFETHLKPMNRKNDEKSKNSH